MKYKAILWDFDGTLADTLGSLLAAYNGLAAKHGFRQVDDPESARGLTPFAFLRSHKVPLFRLPMLVKEMLAAQKSKMAGVGLFPGLAEVLPAIGLRGGLMSIFSSNDQENILACLRANRVEALFASVVGYRRLFGKANGLRRLLKAQKLNGSEAVYVGDEVRDIEAARKAGIASAAVTWGFNTRALLAEHAPDYLIDRADQLLDLLG